MSLPEVGLLQLPLTVPCEPRPQHAETKEDVIEVHAISETMEPTPSHEKKTETGGTIPIKGEKTKNSTSNSYLDLMINTNQIPAGKVKQKFCMRSTVKPRPKPSPLRQMHFAESHESLLSVH